jgi:amidase
MTIQDWKSKAQAKRDSIKSSIPKEWIIPGVSPDTIERAIDFPFHSYLTHQELEITSLSVVDLLSRIARGEYKAVEVARAFSHRAAIAHQLVNCVIEFFWDKAEEQAKELDTYYEKHGKVVGPLHGLPISLKGKDSLDII